jgi:hypothetical protein
VRLTAPFSARRMKKLRFSLLLAAGLACSTVAQATWTARSDYSACPAIEGLTGRQATYASQSDCEAEIADAKRHIYCGVYTCTEDGSGASAAGGDDLTHLSTKALAEGMVHGDAQTFGMGLMGLSAEALLSGSSGPSPEQIAAQQEAERQRQAQIEAAAAAEAARKKKFEDDKQEALGEMKGDGGTGFDADDMKDLKDGPNDNPPPKKKVKIIHLKPVENPLDRQPLPGDFTASHDLDGWEAAKDYAGTAALDKQTGKVVGCPGGFPYYCGGQCYSESALDGLRVPCSSALTTIKFSDPELK